MIIESIEKLIEDPKELLGAVMWMVLGDGNVTIPNKGINGFFQVSHRESSLDYVDMKAVILSKITGVKYKKCWHERQQNYNIQLWTKCHPTYTRLRKRTYLEGRKVISEHSIKLLTPLALAILYQDDGRFNISKSTISINKPIFSELELECLAKGIVDTYGIIFRVRRSCTLSDGSIGHELGLRYSDKDKFFELIRPYVVQSMLYKISTGGSRNADDIVCTSQRCEESDRNNQASIQSGGVTN